MKIRLAVLGFPACRQADVTKMTDDIFSGRRGRQRVSLFYMAVLYLIFYSKSVEGRFPVLNSCLEYRFVAKQLYWLKSGGF
jgi:hypothetical protein